ncbi:MAG: Chromosome (plasmid) partitioning protein ParA [uncultured Thiotrichaceae bacterium]|uniref:Chromosome (Plasmid) partitioning protein ParA n=1 Tax=uncultured Thiotrichaceae bacterium TaxID=298394 RepID=A0A6S6SWA4_9GAMM|nr:MAG: Chromosome (plasmid) partitioning protein ParA [uncultured Thiotrichaceae bacterium]
MITVVGNLKGGTGKSTVAFNLALWTATRQNTRVAVYDLDPQATTTDAFGIRTEEGYLPEMSVHYALHDMQEEDADTQILVDIGLSDMNATQEAIRLADRIIVPVAPSQADIWSTQRFLKIVDEVRGNKPVQLLGLLNRADTHRAVRETGEAAEALEMLDNIQLMKTRLYMRTTYRRSFSEGLAVFEMEPRSKAAAEVEALGKELLTIN